MKIRKIHVGVTFVVGLVPFLVLIFGIFTGTAFPTFQLKITFALITVALALMVQFTYVKASFSNPGLVPKDWKPDENCVYVYKDRSKSPVYKEGDADVYYCTKCDRYKPPRSHHCRRCEKCVLKMDHHCYWIGNCVGHKNHKFFLQFLFYVVLSSTYFIILNLTIVIRYLTQNDTKNIPIFNIIFLVIAAIIALITLISVSMLFFHQMKMLLYNMTSIEASIEKKSKKKI
jgi:palmitoyltransferase